MQSDGLNSALSPVVYGYIALSINTQYNTIQYNTIAVENGKEMNPPPPPPPPENRITDNMCGGVMIMTQKGT